MGQHLCCQAWEELQGPRPAAHFESDVTSVTSESDATSDDVSREAVAFAMPMMPVSEPGSLVGRAAQEVSQRTSASPVPLAARANSPAA